MAKKLSNTIEVDTDKGTFVVDSRQQILAAVRAEFLNALSHMDFEIEHKVKVDEKMAESGRIDYMSGEEDFKIKGATLKRKVDKDSGAFCYFVKITVE